jgi:hypothetical protein
MVSFIVGVASCLVTLWYFNAGAELAAGVTRNGILALRPGMSEERIVALVGRPLFERRLVADANNNRQTSEETTWLYSRTGLFGQGLQVYLSIQHEALAGVYVEDSDLLVYRCDTQKCPETIWKPEVLDLLPTSR